MRYFVAPRLQNNHLLCCQILVPLGKLRPSCKEWCGYVKELCLSDFLIAGRARRKMHFLLVVQLPSMHVLVSPSGARLGKEPARIELCLEDLYRCSHQDLSFDDVIKIGSHVVRYQERHHAIKEANGLLIVG